MAITKHGSGRVIPESDERRKQAAKAWTEEDRRELEAELAEPSAGEDGRPTR